MIQSQKSCCWVQAHSAPPMTGQLTERWAVEARNTTLFRKPAHWVDGRLMSRNNHLPLGLDARFFYRTERDRSWGSKVKRVLSLANHLWEGSAFGRVCESLLSRRRHGQILFELNKSTSVYSQAEGQDPLRQAIMCDYNNKISLRNGSSVQESKSTLPDYTLLVHGSPSSSSGLTPGRINEHRVLISE